MTLVNGRANVGLLLATNVGPTLRLRADLRRPYVGHQRRSNIKIMVGPNVGPTTNCYLGRRTATQGAAAGVNEL